MHESPLEGGAVHEIEADHPDPPELALQKKLEFTQINSKVIHPFVPVIVPGEEPSV
jgi:hypothetical protein